ncbi:MAG: hypothetical protein Q9220_007780, partial [cf. Caloplaca sp. 1 TL-2023]
MYPSKSLFIVLATATLSTYAHPLNLLHSHHAHHAHHHLHLRFPFSSSATKASTPELQHPLTTTTNVAPNLDDISNIFVNMTLTSSENANPTSVLIPLHSSATEKDLQSTTPSIFHHPRTARISNIQYGTATTVGVSRQFERPEDVECYAHGAEPVVQQTKLQRRRKSGQVLQQQQQQQQRGQPFRQSDGE